MTRVRARVVRARMALAACALWLAGVEALPAVHEGLHDQLAPHRHDAGAIITVSLDDTTHRHSDGTIHFVAPHAHRADAAPAHPEHPAHPVRPLRDGRPRAGDLAGHAAGLAHHAAAIAPAAPPILRPLPVDRRPQIVTIIAAIDPVALDPLAATARGPPQLA